MCFKKSGDNFATVTGNQKLLKILNFTLKFNEDFKIRWD